MLGVFQDNFHYEFPNSSIYMLNTQLVIDFEQSSELSYSSSRMLDIYHVIDFEQPPNLLTSMLNIQHVISFEQSVELLKSNPYSWYVG
jgi:hypothetical protein